MKHLCFALILFTLSVHTALGQAVDRPWGISLDGVDAHASDVAVDRDGNRYVVGTYTRDARLGGSLLAATGQRTGFVAKYEPGGRLAWTRVTNAEDTAWATAGFVEVDTAGVVYVAGTFKGVIDWNGLQPTVRLITQNGYLARYSPAGAILSVDNSHFSSSRSATATGLTVLPTGRTFLSVSAIQNDGLGPAVVGTCGFRLDGSMIVFANHISGDSLGHRPVIAAEAHMKARSATGFRGTVRAAGNTTYQSRGGADIAVYTDGDGMRGRLLAHLGGRGEDVVTSIALDTVAQAIYLTGSFTGTAEFGDTAVASEGGQDGFLARLDTGGAVQWVRILNGPGFEQVRNLSLDTAGQIWVTGTYSAGATLHGASLPALGGTDLFAARFSPAGELLYREGFGDAGDDSAAAIGAGPLGTYFLAGQYQDSIRFGPVWVRPVSGTPTTRSGFYGFPGFDVTATVAPTPAVFTVWPNPAQSTVHLPAHSAAQQVDVLDAQGRRVLQTRLAAQETALHLGRLPQGLYLIRVQVPGATVRQARVRVE